MKIMKKHEQKCKNVKFNTVKVFFTKNMENECQWRTNSKHTKRNNNHKVNPITLNNFIKKIMKSNEFYLNLMRKKKSANL